MIGTTCTVILVDLFFVPGTGTFYLGLPERGSTTRNFPLLPAVAAEPYPAPCG